MKTGNYLAGMTEVRNLSEFFTHGPGANAVVLQRIDAIEQFLPA